MQGVRALADEFGIVLILDEVMAGLAVPAAGLPSSRMAWCRIW
jgi:glutamate-1-semialdehyde aminotransferase